MSVTAGTTAIGASGTPDTQDMSDTLVAQRDALAALIVATLSLEMVPGDIDPDAPLFGDGLGLDSIDALEIALAVSRAYGFELRSDNANNQQIFHSLDSLARYVAAHRKI